MTNASNKRNQKFQWAAGPESIRGWPGRFRLLSSGQRGEAGNHIIPGAAHS
jgi:hypothetical protein